MKKRTITLLTVLTCTTAMVLSGCGASTAKKAANLIGAVSEQASENSATETPTATPEPTPSTTQLKLGEKAQVGDWTFKAKKVSTKKMFKVSKYTGYKPTDGNTFVCLSMSVENQGAEEKIFLPMAVTIVFCSPAIGRKIFSSAPWFSTLMDRHTKVFPSVGL